MSKLNPKQARFVAEYLIDSNATQAAIRAGYSKKTAKQQGSRLLTNVDVIAQLAGKQEKVADKLEVTAERVIAELALLGFSNMEDFASVAADGKPALDFSKLSRAQWAAVSQIKFDKDGEITLKLYDKRAALVDLGRHLNLFVENHNHKHSLTDGDGDALPTSPLQLGREIAFALTLAMQDAAKAPKSEPDAATKH